MTWRTFFYIFVVGCAIAVTAFTASSKAFADPTPPPVVAVTAAPKLPVEDPSGRWVLLVIGVGTVLLTYRQAYLSYRR